MRTLAVSSELIRPIYCEGVKVPCICPAQHPLTAEVLWALLERQVLLYTGGDSSSVPLSLAEELLQSLVYCLRFGHSHTVPRCIEPQEQLRFSQQQLVRETEKVKMLYRMARCGTPLAGNAFFRGTLRALGSWFPQYDIRFFAHRSPFDIDYPLAVPVNEALPGIECAGAYLRHLLLELRFVSRFAPGTVRALLHAWLPEWPHLCVNLFEPVFVCALGRTLLGLAPGTLSINEERQLALKSLLQSSSIEKMTKTLTVGVAHLCNHLELWDETMRAYLFTLVPHLVPRLRQTDVQGWSKLFIHID